MTHTPTASATASPTETATPSQAAAGSSTDSSSTPAWVWLLVALVVLALAATIAALLRRRSRMQAWATRFEAAKGEVAWLAREAIPQLGLAPTAQQMAGGWRVAADRVVAAEDQLTALEADAIDDAGRVRARTLRDAVRAARGQLDALAGTQDVAVASNELRAAAAGLEGALAWTDRPPE